MLISRRELDYKIDKMDDDDLLAVIRHGDDFEVIDMDNQPTPKGKHRKQEDNDGVR